MHIVGELTLVIVKPDAIERGLVNKIQSEISAAGLRIVSRHALVFTVTHVQEFYNWAVLYEPSRLEEYLCESESLVWVVAGPNAISWCLAYKRALRVDWSTDRLHTLIHTSDSKEDFLREYRVLFGSTPELPYCGDGQCASS